MKRKENLQNGITLISLVITIIVLLILATVAISMAVDSNGLFARARKAAEDWNKSVGDESTAIENAMLILNEINLYETDPEESTKEKFYFDAVEESSNVQMVNYKTSINLTIKNNDGTNYNTYDTNYEISIVNNNKFTFEEGNTVTKTINGNSILNDMITLNLKTDKTANFIENLTIRVAAIEPYEKQIDIPITINAKTKEYTIKTMINEPLTSGTLSAENIHATKAPTSSEKCYIDGENGLYINDDSDTKNYYISYSFLKEDKYSTSLNVNHIYYVGCDTRLLNNNPNKFGICFSNAWHKDNKPSYGVVAIDKLISDVTENYECLYLYTKPVLSKETSIDGVTYEADYVDTLQIGISVKNMAEVYLKNLIMLDLSDVFGEGNEPPEEWCCDNIKCGVTSVQWFATE